MNLESPVDPIDLLPELHRVILSRLPKGLTNEEIGSEVGLSGRTVERYLLEYIYPRIRVTRRSEAAALYALYKAAKEQEQAVYEGQVLHGPSHIPVWHDQLTKAIDFNRDYDHRPAKREAKQVLDEICNALQDEDRKLFKWTDSASRDVCQLLYRALAEFSLAATATDITENLDCVIKPYLWRVRQTMPAGAEKQCAALAQYAEAELLHACGNPDGAFRLAQQSAEHAPQPLRSFAQRLVITQAALVRPVELDDHIRTGEGMMKTWAGEDIRPITRLLQGIGQALLIVRHPDGTARLQEAMAEAQRGKDSLGYLLTVKDQLAALFQNPERIDRDRIRDLKHKALDIIENLSGPRGWERMTQHLQFVVDGDTKRTGSC